MHNPFQQTRFLLGVAALSQLPPDRGDEVAFAGRSNAGKSSAINTITGQKALARTSKTPGRTQQLNFFAIDDRRRLVDLPGYGYAAVTRTVKERWQRTLDGYLESRRCLRGLVLIMDIRHPLTPYDRLLLDWCRAAALPVHVLLTKADKLGRGQAAAQHRQVATALAGEWPGAGVQLFSATHHLGLEAARAQLARWLDLPPPPDAGHKKAPVTRGE